MKRILQISFSVVFVLVACVFLSRFLPQSNNLSVYAATGSGDICTQQGITDGYPIVSPSGPSCCGPESTSSFGSPRQSGHDACCHIADTTETTWPGVGKAPATVPFFHEISAGIIQADCCITADAANPGAVQTPCGTTGNGYAVACCNKNKGQVCMGVGASAYCATPSGYKCDNNMCISLANRNPALYTNDPDCSQSDVGKPCCSANFPSHIVDLCPSNATAAMVYKCCYSPSVCYQKSGNAWDCCTGHADKICGKAPNQLCCNSVAGTTPVQDCMAKTGVCCNEGPYVGDDTSMKGKTVSKVCGCGANDTNCTCCGANQACDTDINPSTNKPYDICEGMPTVTCSLSPVQGFFGSPTNTIVKPGTLCSVSATATSSPPSPDFVYNWAQNTSSTPPANQSFKDGPKAGSSSYAGGYKAMYNTDFTVTVWNGVGTSNTAECKIGVTDKLKIYCFAGNLSNSSNLGTNEASVDMDEPLTLSGAIDTVANGSPKYTYTWSPSNSVPINSTTNCPSNPNNAVTNTNAIDVYCNGKATVTAIQKAQLCFNQNAEPITSTKTISVVDNTGTTASAACTIDIKPQLNLNATCGKQKVVSFSKSNIWDNTLYCYPYILTLSIPVTATGQVTSSGTIYCSVKGGNPPKPSINSSGATIFTPSCTGNTQTLTEIFKSCTNNFPKTNFNLTDSVTAVSDCQYGSASCTFHIPPFPITVGSVSFNEKLTSFLASLMNMFKFIK